MAAPQYVHACALCKPQSHEEGICELVQFACGHMAHADCQVIKWLPGICWVCRYALTKREKTEICDKMESGHPNLADDDRIYPEVFPQTTAVKDSDAETSCK